MRVRWGEVWCDAGKGREVRQDEVGVVGGKQVQEAMYQSMPRFTPASHTHLMAIFLALPSMVASTFSSLKPRSSLTCLQVGGGAGGRVGREGAVSVCHC